MSGPAERPEFEPEADPGLEPDHDYRRRRKPVPVRKRGGWARLGRALTAAGRSWRALLAVGAALLLAFGFYALLFRSAWFVLQGSDQIRVFGAQRTDRAQVLGVFASDLGRNEFFIPLAARREQIAALPWVRTATVMRIWPARLQVRLEERVPVAFARAGDLNARAGDPLQLIDRDGVLLPRPPSGAFDFPVLSGLGATALARRPAVARYLAFAAAVHDPAISEIDLSRADDLAARLAVPGGGTVLVHFGDANYAARLALFQSQIADWKQKYPNLVSVDLHYDGQAIVDPGAAPAPAATPPPRKPAAKKGRGRP